MSVHRNDKGSSHGSHDSSHGRRQNKPLTEDEINSIIDNELEQSQLVKETKLATDVADAMDLYLGKPFGTEMDGRSHFVSRDVMDTIEWIMPVLMDIYTSTDTPVVIEPQNEEDVLGAAQETAFMSYVMNRQNPGFTIVHNFFKDCLMSKIGIVKNWWDETQESIEEEYENLTDAELDELLVDESVEVIQHTAIDEETKEETAELISNASHNVKIKRIKAEKQIRLENVPPEEFKIDRRAKSKADASMMAHITTKTVSDIIAMGITSRKTIERIATETGTSGESADQTILSAPFIARHREDSTDPKEFLSTRVDLGMRELVLEEVWIKIDQDNDGIAELRQIFRINKEILSNEAQDAFPFNFTSPILIPHKLIGLSVAELVADLQRIKSHLIRAMLDNINSANNGRFSVLEGAVNIEDLLTTRPLNIVRVRAQNALQRLDHPPLPPETFQMLGYLDQVREGRTGVNGVSQGLDEKIFGSNTPSSAVTQLMSAAQQRVQLIARVLAETGLREIYRDIHRLALTHVKAEQVFQLTGTFVTVKPDTWRSRRDFTVRVGTGHVNKEQKMFHLNLLTQDIQALISSGKENLVTDKNLYNLEKEKIMAAGFKNISDFITDPDRPGNEREPTADETAQQQQLDISIQIAQAELEIKNKAVAVKEAEVQIKAAELEIKQQDAQVSATRAEAEIQKLEHDKVIAELEVKLKQQELQLEKDQGRGVKIG